MRIEIITREDNSTESGTNLTTFVWLLIIVIGVCGGWAFLIHSVTGR
jgi:hypothetical protein